MSTQKNDNYNRTNGGNIFWGVVCIAAAVMLVLSRLGFLEDLLPSTVLFTVIFAATLIRSLVKRNMTGTIFSIALLAIIYGKQFDIEELHAPTILLAACLLTIGLQMIFHSRRRRIHHEHHEHPGEQYHTATDSQTENTFFCSNSLGSSTRYVHASHLETAEIKNSFGETTVYFDNVQLSEKGATIHVNNSFGETTLYIPREWNIICNLSCTFGDAKIPPENITADAPQVTITGNVSFGECIIQRM